MSSGKYCGILSLILSWYLIGFGPLNMSGQSPSADDRAAFKYQKLMVPVRDGVRLETVVLRPRNEQGAMPILFTRTPYGVPKDGEYQPDANIVLADPYIVVFQNIRGRFGSEGEFEMFRPPRSLRDPKAVDEVTDAWDRVDWLVVQCMVSTPREPHDSDVPVTGVVPVQSMKGDDEKDTALLHKMSR